MLEFKDHEYEKLKFSLEKEKNRTFRLENQINANSIIIENLKSELIEYKETLQSINQSNNKILQENKTLENKNNELQSKLEKISYELSSKTSENEKFKELVEETNEITQTNKNFFAENEKLISKVVYLETYISNIFKQKEEILLRLSQSTNENSLLSNKILELESMNKQLSGKLEKEIFDHVKDYKDKTLDLLNNPISPRTISPIRNFGKNNATPNKADIKSKIEALQLNRARIEARMKEMTSD